MLKHLKTKLKTIRQTRNNGISTVFKQPNANCFLFKNSSSIPDALKNRNYNWRQFSGIKLMLI